MRSSSAREWSTVLDAIEKDLLTGKVQPGDRLPPDRVLASTPRVRKSLEADVLVGADDLADWASTAHRLRREHREIVLTIIAGDGARAATLIQDHISGYYNETHLIRSG